MKTACVIKVRQPSESLFLWRCFTPSQNLVSAALAPETTSEILAALTDIKSKMAFVVSLTSTGIQSLFKVGNGYAPFFDKAYSVAIDHPEILPAVFNLDEFKKDYLLYKALASIVDKVNELAASLNNTLTAVSSDAIVSALEVYAAVKQNSAKVPGLSVANTEMAQFFKKTRKKAEAKV